MGAKQERNFETYSKKSYMVYNGFLLYYIPVLIFPLMQSIAVNMKYWVLSHFMMSATTFRTS
jgi:hypothetical protein